MEQEYREESQTSRNRGPDSNLAGILFETELSFHHKFLVLICNFFMYYLCRVVGEYMYISIEREGENDIDVVISLL